YPRGSNEWASFGERCRVFVENFFRLSRGAEGQLSPSGCVLLSKRFCCSPCSLHLCVLCVLCRSREHRETSLEAALISHIYFPADGCNIRPHRHSKGNQSRQCRAIPQIADAKN